MQCSVIGLRFGCVPENKFRLKEKNVWEFA